MYAAYRFRYFCLSHLLPNLNQNDTSPVYYIDSYHVPQIANLEMIIVRRKK
jgi:hypothetical protein